VLKFKRKFRRLKDNQETRNWVNEAHHTCVCIKTPLQHREVLCIREESSKSILIIQFYQISLKNCRLDSIKYAVYGKHWYFTFILPLFIIINEPFFLCIVCADLSDDR
jgi:hypothetical protein